jgi:hypothetical protein
LAFSQLARNRGICISKKANLTFDGALLGLSVRKDIGDLLGRIDNDVEGDCSVLQNIIEVE